MVDSVNHPECRLSDNQDTKIDSQPNDVVGTMLQYLLVNYDICSDLGFYFPQ